MARAAAVSITVTGIASLKRALTVLSDPNAPFLTKALEDAGGLLARAAAVRAKGGIASSISFIGVKGAAPGLRAIVNVRHPGAASMEFGRHIYYRGYHGRSMKSGQKFATRGQQARPYIGIVHDDAAVGETAPQIQKLIENAISAEWDRITSEGD